MKKYFGSIVIVVLFFLLVFSFLANMRILEKAKTLDSQKRILTTLLRTEKKNMSLELKNSVTKVKDILLSTSDGDTLTLDYTEGVKRGVKLIFRYDKVECRSCTQEITSILKEYLEKDSLLKQIIIIGKYDNTDNIRINKNYWGTKFVYGIVRDVDSSPNEFVKPYFFMIDNDCRIINVFIPDANNIDQLICYLKAYSEMISE